MSEKSTTMLEGCPRRSNAGTKPPRPLESEANDIAKAKAEEAAAVKKKRPRKGKQVNGLILGSIYGALTAISISS